ncbi:MAG: hypothetical protein GC165_09760 [Armatimonadetes bacterium]|nr:hypothetical protein [Armatimonadota bacterium]MBS1728582.1 hypothetical protein [Armatimonadota bacterium]
MTQSELLRQIETYFRLQDEAAHPNRQKVREEQEAVTDDEWWAQAKAQMAHMRPEFLEVIERNKEQMIRDRNVRFDSEAAYRERIIKQKAVELLPFVAAIRAETNAASDVTEHEILSATARRDDQAAPKAEKNVESNPSRMEQLAQQVRATYDERSKDLN